MNFRIANTKIGYIALAYLDVGSGRHQYYPLRNFGNLEADALKFMQTDCPKLTKEEINQLTKTYSQEETYKRIGRKLKKQNGSKQT